MSFYGVAIKREFEADVRQGSPWVFAGWLANDSEIKTCAPGDIVYVTTTRGEVMGTAYAHPESNIAMRLLSRHRLDDVSQNFFMEAFKAALEKRSSIKNPYYRLVHAESDHLPGLIIDRYGDVVVLQINTVGMHRLLPHITAALDALIHPAAVILRYHLPEKEKLTGEALPPVKILKGEVPAISEVWENDICYYAKLLEGQKTGWYYDQRDNHHWLMDYVQKHGAESVLDVFCYNGGFGVAAAKAGAKQVTFVDDSALALEMTQKAIAKNNLSVACTYIDAKASQALDDLAAQKMQYDVVVLDPPPFIKDKRSKPQGYRAYQKLMKQALLVLKPNGLVVYASCSHHISRSELKSVMNSECKAARRNGEIIHEAGAAPDHPVHPALPQTEYLHCVVMKIA